MRRIKGSGIRVLLLGILGVMPLFSASCTQNNPSDGRVPCALTSGLGPSLTGACQSASPKSGPSNVPQPITSAAPSAAPSSTPIDVSGTYVGNANDPISGLFPAQLTIKQNGTQLTGSWQSATSTFTYTSGSLSGFSISLGISTNTLQRCPPNGSTITAVLQQDLRTLKGSITCGTETNNFELVK